MPKSKSRDAQSIKEKQKPGLYIVATPIGNLGDITLRALETLKSVDLIACEDTRTSGKLLTHFGINTKRITYHEHNADQMRPKLLELMQENAIALISDAGTPLISDPGYKLVKDCHDHNIPVTSLPGPSALITGLTLSGLPTNHFYFAGFLPAKSGARKAALQNLRLLEATLIFYESPNRIAETIKDMHETLGNRGIVITRELTKTFEQRLESDLETLSQTPPTLKGEIIILLEGHKKTADPESEIDALLTELLKTMSPSEAAKQAAHLTGRPKSDLYKHALNLKNPQND